MKKVIPVCLALGIAGCADRATVETNAVVNAQLNDIAENTSDTDGMDQGNAAMMATPGIGQQLDAKQQPPK